MEIQEKSKQKTNKNKEETSKIMTAIAAPTIRELVTISNKYSIKREDVVTIIKDNGQFVLIHYSPSV